MGTELRPRSASLTIVMPAFNEADTVEAAVASVLQTELACRLELIVVDDGSTDGTGEILDALDDPRVLVLHHARNRGKGAAVRTGLTHATGTYLIVFDADLEYAATDIATVFQPVANGDANVVFGARVSELREGRPALRFSIGNRFFTGLANALFGAELADLHTCLKLAPTNMLRVLMLDEEGFGLDTQLTVELLRHRIPITSVPISYRPRDRQHGKKITWRDGVRCLALLLGARLKAVPDLLDLRDPAPTLGNLDLMPRTVTGAVT